MRRAPVVTLLALSFVVLGAPPAGAHGVGGREPSNVRVDATHLEPALAGVSVRMVDAGTRIELHNASGDDVVVLGYDGEPYVRVGPRGVFENARSPAVFLNRTLDPPGAVPEAYDAGAPPEWRRTGNGDTVRWHDHRAHWMGSEPPPEPVAWIVPLDVGGARGAVHGEMAWVAPPPWWPWLALAVAIAGLVVLAARRHWRAAAVATIGTLVVAELVHVAAGWSEVASTTDGRIAANGMSAIAVLAGAVALVRAARRGAFDAAPWVVLGATVLLVVGASDVLVWFRSQIPSALPAPLVRAMVALAIGGGAGLIAAAAPHLRAAAAPERSA